jgi:outer membrane protein assembly factor BamB
MRGRLAWRVGAALGLWCVTSSALACDRPAGPGGRGPRVVWRADGAGGPVEPAFDSTTVYFGGFDHELVAVDRATGQLRWRRGTGVGSPVTEGDNVVLAGELAFLPDVDLYAFDRRTGELRWIFSPTGAQTGRWGVATDGRWVYTGSPEGLIYAVVPTPTVPASGSVTAWTARQPLPAALDPNADPVAAAFNPVVDGGVLYVGGKRFGNPSTGGLAAFDAATGRLLWHAEFAPEHPGQSSGCFGGVGLAPGVVIAAAEDGRVYALDRATGAVQWVAPRVHPLPSESSAGSYDDTRPVRVVGGVAVVGSTTGVVVGLDAATGRERWRTSSGGGSVIDRLTTDGELAFVGALGGNLLAIDARTGAIRWQTGIVPGEGGEFWPMPAVDGDRLYVAGKRGFYALLKQ